MRKFITRVDIALKSHLTAILGFYYFTLFSVCERKR